MKNKQNGWTFIDRAWLLLFGAFANFLVSKIIGRLRSKVNRQANDPLEIKKVSFTKLAA
jgi:hypothetical protein